MHRQPIKNQVSTNPPTAAPQDVRMRGFRNRATVDEALAWIDQHATLQSSETVSLRDAQSRVLANDVTAVIDVPSFDRAAMDGYAIRGEETIGAGDYNPLSFRLLGESMPGQLFNGKVETGTAVRIMTGAPVPAGANAVIPAEYATESNDVVEITTSVAPRKHVGARGEDIRANSLLLHTGRRLRPQDVGLLASTGIDSVKVVRRPEVRLIITGNELIEPGKPRGSCEIFESNSFVLAGLIRRDSGRLCGKLQIEDDRTAIRAALVEPGADVILVSGGSSVGAEDHAPTIVAEVGELAIHGIAMRPSSPTGLGQIGDTLVFLLPGNPVSCLCAYDFFAGRAIRQMSGRSAVWPYVVRQANVAMKIASAIGRVDYCRVRVRSRDDDNEIDPNQPLEIEPISLSGASILSSTTRADGFVIVPADCEGYPPGTDLNVYLYDPVN